MLCPCSEENDVHAALFEDAAFAFADAADAAAVAAAAVYMCMYTETSLKCNSL